MKFSQLKNILQDEPAYRLEQVKKAVFVDLIKNWNEATTLPVELREKLDKEFSLETNAEVFESKDKKTIKALIELDDGLKIEAVLMSYESERNTVCVSSQVGCALGCDFCATGKMGFKRNLSVDEIIEQVLFFQRMLKGRLSSKKSSFSARRLLEEEKKITNIVFMGMGEPFLNYDNVLAAIKILNDQKGFNLGARHFSISTAGIVEGIKRLADEELQINLAISLHTVDDKLRSEIMPINKKYPVKKILAAVDKYIEKTNRKVMFEYVMISGINDGDKQAKELAMIMQKPLYFVNLIPCNPIGRFEPPAQEKIESFKAILKKNGVQVGQRYSFGQDISAACGQLAGQSKFYAYSNKDQNNV